MVTTETDNRLYDYSGWTEDDRQEYKYIVSLVKLGSSLVDLGCGNGSLMQKLIKEKNVKAEGMDLSRSGVDICIEKGLKVKEGRIDAALPYQDNEFDYAVCNVTMQMVMFPEILLKEMKRIARYQIISFPNIGFYKHRLELFMRGRMPKGALFGFSWYNTGHIHLFSIKDFYELMSEIDGLEVTKHLFVESDNRLKDLLMRWMPNLFQVLPVFLLKKNDA